MGITQREEAKANHFWEWKGGKVAFPSFSHKTFISTVIVQPLDGARFNYSRGGEKKSRGPEELQNEQKKSSGPSQAQFIQINFGFRQNKLHFFASSSRQQMAQNGETFSPKKRRKLRPHWSNSSGKVIFINSIFLRGIKLRSIESEMKTPHPHRQVAFALSAH